MKTLLGQRADNSWTTFRGSGQCRLDRASAIRERHSKGGAGGARGRALEVQVHLVSAGR